jgi:transposase
MRLNRKGYPSDVGDEEWSFCAPYLTLMTQTAPQRDYPLREVFNGLRWFVRAGCPWRMMPIDLPAWPVVYQQTRRWLRAGCFEAMAHDLRAVLRIERQVGGGENSRAIRQTAPHHNYPCLEIAWAGGAGLGAAVGKDWRTLTRNTKAQLVRTAPVRNLVFWRPHVLGTARVRAGRG